MGMLTCFSCSSVLCMRQIFLFGYNHFFLESNIFFFLYLSNENHSTWLLIQNGMTKHPFHFCLNFCDELSLHYVTQILFLDIMLFLNCLCCKIIYIHIYLEKIAIPVKLCFSLLDYEIQKINLYSHFYLCKY